MTADPIQLGSDLMEQVVAITEQRDQESLKVCLVDTLWELSGAERVALYGLGAEADVRNPRLFYQRGMPDAPRVDEDCNGIEALVSQAAHTFSDRLKKKKNTLLDNLASPDSPSRIFYPIFDVEKKLNGLLAVDYIQLSPSHHNFVTALLRIFHNYQQLLNENQRDRLTGLLNRRSFDEQLARVLSDCQRPFKRRTDIDRGYLAVLDIDHFKRINDTFGHLYGDEVLLLFARLMKGSFRNEDLLFRFGGEEFIILLRAPDDATCCFVLDRFRKSVENYDFPQVGQVTVSIGCIAMDAESLPTTLLDRADRALYYAKHAGRNQVRFYAQLLADRQLSNEPAQTGSIDLF